MGFGNSSGLNEKKYCCKLLIFRLSVAYSGLACCERRYVAVITSQINQNEKPSGFKAKQAPYALNLCLGFCE